MPYKQFTPVTLTASDVNTYLMNQSVIAFANAAARTTALPLPTEGMFTYLQDTDELEVYDGSTWLRVVVTSDDESITTSGAITSSSSTVTGNVAASNVLARVQNSATDGYSTVLLGSALQNNAGVWRNGSAQGGYGGNNSLNIGTVGAEPVTLCTTNTVRVTLDASGRFLIPNQPAFQAYGPVASPASGTFPVRLLNTYLNRGSVYNPATGYFTAPVAGAYLFSWSFLTSNNNDVFRWFLRKNGTTIGDLHLRADTGATGSEFATNASKTWIIQLVAGDTVAIYYAADAGTAFYNAGGDEYSNFGGYLIG